MWYLTVEDTREANSFARSWSLSGAQMLLPTLAINFLWFVVPSPFSALAHHLTPGLKSFAYLDANLSEGEPYTKSCHDFSVNVTP